MKSVRSLQRSVLTKLGRLEQESDELQTLGSLLKDHEANLDLVLKAASKHSRSAQMAGDDYRAFAESLQCYGDLIEGRASTTSSSLKLIADFIQTTEQRRGDYQRDLEAKVLNRLRSFLKEDINAAKEQKKKHTRVWAHLEDCREEMEEMKANKKVALERKKEIEEAFETARTTHLQSEYETTSVFLDCTKENSFVVLEGMLESFDLLYAYHCMCQNWLEQKRPAIDELRAKLKEEKETYERTSSLRASRTPAQKAILHTKHVLFGNSLRAVLRRDREAGSQDCIPKTIRMMIDHILKYGLKVRRRFGMVGL